MPLPHHCLASRYLPFTQRGVSWNGYRPTSTCFVIQGDPRNLPEYETQTFSENDVRQGGLNTA
jgi:hypothetical protein